MGYFKLERGWSDHIVFDNEPLTQREAWVWLIEHAAWRDTVMSVGRERYQVQRGQLAASVRYLALRWQWSKSRVARFLNRLKSETMIGTEERQHASIITICNYTKYQDERDSDETESGTPTGTAAGQQRDSSGTKKKAIKADINIEAEEELSRAFSAFVDLAQQAGLPVPRDLDADRRSKLSQRLKDCGGLNGWVSTIGKIRGSPFLLGERSDFKADFDFVLQRKSFRKLMEGGYDGGSRVQGSKSRSTGGFASIVLEQGFGRGFGGVETAGGSERGPDQGGESEAGGGPNFAATG